MSTSPGLIPSQRLGYGTATGDTMPDDLKRQALMRLTSLLRVLFALHVLGLLFNVVGPRAFGWATGCSVIGAAEHVLGLLLTWGFLFAIRRSRNSEQMLNYGLTYQVVTCFVGAFAEQTRPHSGISIVAVLILIFPLFVPREASRTFVAGLLSAAVAPLAYALFRLSGDAAPSELFDASVLPQFGMNFLFAALAVVPSKVVARMTQEVKDARRMGAYELVEKLGSGGMGEVWRGQHSLLRRPAAIKLVKQDGLTALEKERALHRFEREAQATAELESPHTVELFDFGTAQDGSLFYVMELLNGIDLETFVKRFGPMDPERAVFVLRQVCDSLDDAHAHGLVHRDVKPANILLCKKGRQRDFVKVVDFGLVRPTLDGPSELGVSQTAEGQIRGTPGYLSPEAITGESLVDARSDLYSLGCVAYYLLTGKLVFDAASPMKVAIAHAIKEPVNVAEVSEHELPGWLSELVMTLLDKTPSKRPESALVVAQALERELSRPWTQSRAERWWQEFLPDLDGRRNRGPAQEDCQHARRCELRMGRLTAAQG